MKVLDTYREDMETMEELNQYKSGGRRNATKETRQKVLRKIGRESETYEDHKQTNKDN